MEGRKGIEKENGCIRKSKEKIFYYKICSIYRKD